MTDEKYSDTAEPEVAKNLGEKLAQAREALGLSIGEVAERLKLSAKQIEALEKNDYENLPEPVFVRGFLRTYARFLKLDEESILADLNAALPKKEEIKKQAASVSGTKIQSAGSKGSHILFGGIAVIALIIIGLFVFDLLKTPEEVQIPESRVEVGELAEPNLDTENHAAQSANQAAEKEAIASEASSERVLTTHGLTIKVKYRSNLYVRDAEGKEFINQVVPAGSEHHFDGKKPFNIRMGYAKGAIVKLDGRQVDITPDIQGSTAAFKVPK